MTLLNAMAEAYWNAFRDGYFRVGGRPEDYPTWAQSTDPVKAETLRCLRHAVEQVKPHFTDGLFDDLFPEPLAKRSRAKPTPNDADFVKSQKIARMEG